MQVKNKRIPKIIVNLMGNLIKSILITVHKRKALELYLVRKKNNLIIEYWLEVDKHFKDFYVNKI